MLAQMATAARRRSTFQPTAAGGAPERRRRGRCTLPQDSSRDGSGTQMRRWSSIPVTPREIPRRLESAAPRPRRARLRRRPRPGVRRPRRRSARATTSGTTYRACAIHIAPETALIRRSSHSTRHAAVSASICRCRRARHRASRRPCTIRSGTQARRGGSVVALGE